jgi:hypothetical protein
MNLNETARALALVQSFDRRTVGEADVVAWRSVLTDVALADAEEAIRRHYAEQTDWLMPAHIRRYVRDIVREREALASATEWAPGQAGVPKDQAMPEISGPVAEGDLTPSVRALLESVRAMLPEGSREALMPRRVAWEREHRAYVRVRDGQPNPLYKPKDPRYVDQPRPMGSFYDPMPDRDDPALNDWLRARGWDSYQEWAERGGQRTCCSDPTCRCEPGECTCSAG